MKSLQFNLRVRERCKYTSATPFIPYSAKQSPVCGYKNRVRGLDRKRRHSTARNHTSDVDEVGANAPDLNPINLTPSELTDAERSLLSKGLSFCSTPRDVNWQKTSNDLEKFEKRIRLAVFHHDKGDAAVTPSANTNLPPVPSTSNWMPPKSIYPKVELFINNVKQEILDPKNIQKSRDNLTKEERLAIRNLRSNDNVISVQDKGSWFVILSR